GTGATEPGGGAGGPRRRGGEPWQLLRGVEATVDRATGCLAVASPFVSAPDGERFATADRVAFTDTGEFHLLGRADRVIKIGEKRLSLPDMEEQLRAHPAVDDVALLSMEKGTTEPRVAAVVVPSATAWDTVAEARRRALAK